MTIASSFVWSSAYGMQGALRNKWMHELSLSTFHTCNETVNQGNLVNGLACVLWRVLVVHNDDYDTYNGRD
jgi:hypothetical protein